MVGADGVAPSSHRVRAGPFLPKLRPRRASLPPLSLPGPAALATHPRPVVLPNVGIALVVQMAMRAMGSVDHGIVRIVLYRALPDMESVAAGTIMAHNGLV